MSKYDWRPFFCVWPRNIQGELVSLRWVWIRTNWRRPWETEVRLTPPPQMVVAVAGDSAEHACDEIEACLKARSDG